MPNYRSLVPGGYFSANPSDRALPVTIRMNNPGAINGVEWIRSYPGYVGETETTPGNKSASFETPEQGVAVWWDLMRRYRAKGAVTLGAIVVRYGGGQQNYSVYAKRVSEWTGLPLTQEIRLYGDDATLLKFAKAMFRYEAGKPIPWSDAQILRGFEIGRATVAGQQVPDHALPPAPAPAPTPSAPSLLSRILEALARIFGGSGGPQPLPPSVQPLTRILRPGARGPDVETAQRRLAEIGFSDVVVDGDFGEVMEKAVRAFQLRRNLDPDGEIGDMTWAEMWKADAAHSAPPLSPPSPVKWDKPPWYAEAEKDLGFRETGNNRGIEKLIADAGYGRLGDPWCQIAEGAWLKRAGFKTTGSAMARSTETSPNFVRLSGPALGAICPMWRGSPSSGSGHTFLYDGESSKGVRGIGANEDDMVKRSFHDRKRITGYYWPKDAPLPKIGPIPVGDDKLTGGNKSET